MRSVIHSFFLLTAVALYAPAATFSVTGTTDANALISSILGSGVTVVGTPTYVGASNQSGSFTGGLSSRVPFDTGVVLTSGDATRASVPYQLNDPGTSLFTAGDPRLTALAGQQTFDAAVLTFSFTSSQSNLFVNYAFASSEYPFYVGSQYNDVFAFYLNGTNVAVVPGTTLPVTVNNVNSTTNAGSFAGYTATGFPNFEYGGITTQLTASGALLPGVNTISIAIADSADTILDSAVFIQGGTFTTVPQAPEPATLGLLGLGIVVAVGVRKRLR